MAQGERIRVFQNKDGEPFSSYEMANRFLTVMRAKVDAGEFDPREYIKVEVKRPHFDNYTAAWLGRREKEVERGHLFLLMMETGCRPMDRNVYREHTKEGDVWLLHMGGRIEEGINGVTQGHRG